MTLAIMQPYLFPYIGYFQLMKMADVFVIHDDVQYIKAGWVNRNRILQNGKDVYLTLPLKNDSAYLNINERIFCSDIELVKSKQLRVLENAYRNAPHFEMVYPLLVDIFSSKQTNLSAFLVFSLEKMMKFLGFDKELILSSSINKNNQAKGQERVIEICKKIGCSTYVNPIGGKELYNKNDFRDNGIDLFFLKAKSIVYQQFSNQFVEFLSIIDVVMFNSGNDLTNLLNQFELE
jgi:hypothetical protein